MRKSALLSIVLVALCAGTPRAAAPSSAPEALNSQGAVALAEKFVAAQGFTDLRPQAVGARAESDVWFVGFQPKIGSGIRGIMITNNGKTIKRVSQNLQLDWLQAKAEPLKPADAGEAKSLAADIAAGVKGLPAKPAKTTENKANPAGDPWNSWWVWYEKPAKAGAKTRSYAIVSVNKDTRQTKWVTSAGKTAAP